MDSTVKPLYGHQEDAKRGYNPSQPGRPSHVYHSLVDRKPTDGVGGGGTSGESDGFVVCPAGVVDVAGRIADTELAGVLRGEWNWGHGAGDWKEPSSAPNRLSVQAEADDQGKKLIERWFGVTERDNLPLRARLFSGGFSILSGFCGGMDTLLQKQPQYPWCAEPFPLAGFSPNRPRRAVTIYFRII